MAGYDDWTPEFQDVWEEIPGSGYWHELSELGEQAQELFERGFMPNEDLSADERFEAREEFFELTGLPEEMFPWDDWRKAMGYE
jgi:hypothetical protein